MCLPGPSGFLIAEMPLFRSARQGRFLLRIQRVGYEFLVNCYILNGVDTVIAFS